MIQRRSVPALGLLVVTASACQQRAAGDGRPCDVDADCDDAVCVAGFCEVELDGGDGGHGPDALVRIAGPRQLDVLFVIDNTGSMGDEQARLARGADALFDVLDDPDSGVDYRIGFTTTDNGNVECTSTTPEGGSLRMNSCTTRHSEFIWPKLGPGDFDTYWTVCAPSCPLDEGDDLLVLPTPTAKTRDPAPRPWLERTAGHLNVEGLTSAEAFGCLAPQGTDGCGFEAPLESMYKAVARAEIPSEPQYDFLRPSAGVAAFLVTDEADCSANGAHQALVFDRNLDAADKVFWENPQGTVPTSAICWNAGVRCEGMGGLYTDCRPHDYAVDGSSIDDPSDASDAAVLHPLARYIDQLGAIEAAKRDFDPNARVVIGGIMGVPPGYETGMVDLTYQDATDPQHQEALGIGFGCMEGSYGAVPPVRLRELAEAFDTHEDGRRNLHSICADDYAGALADFARAAIDALPSRCYPRCVADLDESTSDTLEVDCAISMQAGNSGERSVLAPCQDGTPLAGDTACYVLATGNPKTNVKGVPMPAECVDAGWNLAIEVVASPDRTLPSGSTFSASCQLSDFPELDCPLR